MDEIKNQINVVLIKILDCMNLGYSIEYSFTNSGRPSITAHIKIEEGANFLIGKGGENIKELETIVRLMIKNTGDVAISLDVNDYKHTKLASLLGVIEGVVGQVISTGKALALDPMSAYERRMVHMALATRAGISTESIGEGANRRIVIRPNIAKN